jgi:hypothetical protein
MGTRWQMLFLPDRPTGLLPIGSLTALLLTDDSWIMISHAMRSDHDMRFVPGTVKVGKLADPNELDHYGANPERF